MKRVLAIVSFILLTAAIMAVGTGQVWQTGSSAGAAAGEATIPLKEAKLNIEHNATDHDTGFQGAIDSEGWKRLSVTGPGGQVLALEGKGKLGRLGLTELFFETVEPANADVPLNKVLSTLPSGKYTIEGPAIEAGRRTGWTRGVAWLTHTIPAGPILVTPTAGAVVPAGDDLDVSWEPVTRTIDGARVKIIAYQLIIEKDEEPHRHMIGKRGLSMYLPASVTSTTVPRGFLEPGTHYLWEVLAIEKSGNQTLSSSEFNTR
jgi:hypothetical protein